MLDPSQLQIGQEYNVRLELSEIAPGGVIFAMPSGINVFLCKKRLRPHHRSTFPCINRRNIN